MGVVAFAGRVVYIGYAKASVSYETKLFVQKELDTLGSRNAIPQDFNGVIEMLQQDGFPMEEAITTTVPLARAGEPCGSLGFRSRDSANALSEKPVPSVEPSLTTRTSEGPSTFSRRKAATFSSVVGSRCSSLSAGTTNGKGGKQGGGRFGIADSINGPVCPLTEQECALV